MTTYSSKSNAARAARSAGLGRANCYQLPCGAWGFRALAVDLGAPHCYPQAPAPAVPAPAAKPQAPAAKPQAPAAPVPPAKVFELYGRSSVLSPVALVHDYLDRLVAEGCTPVRREALCALAGMGVNRHTARTQYQRWHSARAGR